MRKEASLTLRIPSPCSQDWNGMPIKEGGRYCDRCTQIVHDFSQMPDKELLQYFKTKPDNSCGRFHKHQLNRVISPQKKRWLLPTYIRKIAAAILAALSFRTAPAQGIIKSKPSVATHPAVTVEKNPVPGSIVISGKITKGNEEPVANAKVSVDTLITVYTDADGKFTIPLSGDLIASHNLYFSYEGLERTVRTFHPLMGSTYYDVRLMSKEDYNYNSNVMGLIAIPNGLQIGDLPSIHFTKNKNVISKDAQAILMFVSEKLKDYPLVKIKLVAYGDNSKEEKLATVKLKLTKNFLVKKGGIDNARIEESIEATGSNDIIDLVQYFGE